MKHINIAGWQYIARPFHLTTHTCKQKKTFFRDACERAAIIIFFKHIHVHIGYAMQSLENAAVHLCTNMWMCVEISVRVGGISCVSSHACLYVFLATNSRPVYHVIHVYASTCKRKQCINNTCGHLHYNCVLLTTCGACCACWLLSLSSPRSRWRIRESVRKCVFARSQHKRAQKWLIAVLWKSMCEKNTCVWLIKITDARAPTHAVWNSRVLDLRKETHVIRTENICALVEISLKFNYNTYTIH